MTRMPEQERGYRDGSRAIVTSMHAHADALVGQVRWGPIISLNFQAHRIGALGKQNRNNSSPTPRITTAAARHAQNTTHNEDHLTGYLIAIDHAIADIEQQCTELNDPKAKQVMEELAAKLTTIHQRLLHGDEWFWIKPTDIQPTS